MPKTKKLTAADIAPVTLAIYQARCEAQGLEWAEYADCDEWTLSMLFDSFDVEDEWED